MSRKIRSDSWYSALSDEAKMKIFGRVDQFGLDACRSWIHEEFHLPTPSLAAMYRFYKAMRARESEWRIQKALTDRGEIENIVRATGDVSEAVASGIGQLALDAVLRKDADAIKQFVSSLCDLRKTREAKLQTDLDAARARIAALEELTDRINAARANAKTPAEQEQLIKEIFA